MDDLKNSEWVALDRWLNREKGALGEWKDKVAGSTPQDREAYFSDLLVAFDANLMYATLGRFIAHYADVDQTSGWRERKAAGVADWEQHTSVVSFYRAMGTWMIDRKWANPTPALSLEVHPGEVERQIFLRMGKRQQRKYTKQYGNPFPPGQCWDPRYVNRRDLSQGPPDGRN